MGSQSASASDEKKMITEPLLSDNLNPKGGLRTMPFIIANEAFERVASLGLLANMILYLSREYNMETTEASNILFIWSAVTNFTPILGAFIADSYTGRYQMVCWGSIATLLGMVLLWSTAMFEQAKPPPCEPGSSICEPPTTFQLLLLYSSFGLMSIGAGGIRSSSLAFGADQLSRGDNLKDAGILQSYFSWYYVSVTVSSMFAVTCIVYIQDNMGWKVGLGVPAVLMFLSVLSFLLASPFYIKLKAKTSLLAGIAQVFVASYNNRHMKLSSQPTDEIYHQRRGSMLLKPSEKLSFRREIAIKEGFSDNPRAVVHMSSMWLLPHYVLAGLALAFNIIGQTQFYYSELPKTMSSIGSSLVGVGMSAASLVSSFIMNAVDDVTKRGGKESWVSTNINKGHYDYYYWLLAGLSMGNFMYFLACSKAYGPCKEEEMHGKEKDSMSEELCSSAHGGSPILWLVISNLLKEEEEDPRCLFISPFQKVKSTSDGQDYWQLRREIICSSFFSLQILNQMGSESSSTSDEKKVIMEPLLSDNPNPKGGLRTMPFIIANEAFERVASIGLHSNMIMYLTREYNLESAAATNILFIWSAVNNLMPVLGAFIADSYAGRYRMVGFGSIATLLGMVLLWLTAIIPNAKPPLCDPASGNCEPPTTFQLLFLYSSFGFMSIGGGGIRSSSLAFGADQLNRGDNIENAGILQRYFSWYYVAVSVSSMFAVTCIVYIQDNLGWQVGLGVPAVLMFLSVLSFFLASPLYVKLKAKTSLLTELAQVIVASYKNRHMKLSSQATDEIYHHKKGSMLLMPSENLR
ncbi:hypothetical protein Pint_12822 [Pistacia integerrima]|uniref:Uncharacterized protein n=1 Tax=Pistacia integerrima TaxID=434235 RepID=A0ACC0YC05_9ROSI|nr:hypothetical protein Pint_12822 [Pistacia integerrima]